MADGLELRAGPLLVCYVCTIVAYHWRARPRHEPLVKVGGRLGVASGRHATTTRLVGTTHVSNGASICCLHLRGPGGFMNDDERRPDARAIRWPDNNNKQE